MVARLFWILYAQTGRRSLATVFPEVPMTRAEIVCIFGPALLLIGGLVGFSCIRDAIAVRALAPGGPIVTPLHP